jgi:4-hydroxybenzoate polyprenyltransferase
MVSWRVALFYSVYIFLIWFYSHKLKKYPIIGNITASLLAILPFFGILLYYTKKDHFRNLETSQMEIIFSHAAFLFLLLLIREMIKDLENLTGDFATNYKTIPVVYGETTSKKAITMLTFISVIPIYLLVTNYDVRYMDIYFYCCLIVLGFILTKLWNATEKAQYLKLHNLLKVLIVAGVFCIVLIEPQVLVHGRNLIPEVGF